MAYGRVRGLPAPEPGHRAALAWTERVSAAGTLLSSLEYLARRADRAPGGLNDWTVMRAEYAGRPRLRRLLDVVAAPAVTDALHVVRAGSAAVLLLPGAARRPRLAANLALAATTVLLRPRHRYGGDGADQANLVVQVATAVARAGEANPATVDACLWFVAAQSVLSYAASGWAKLAGPAWRRGDALAGILGTHTFGDRTAAAVVRRHPVTARVLGGAVVALESGFPLVFAARGLVPVFLWPAAVFHLVNGRVMGLGRFAWTFLAMHPAVWYVRSRRPAVRYRGGTLLVACALAAWFAVTAAGQHPRGRFDRVRDLDPIGGLIPDWRFFAPEPVRHDHAVVYRAVRTDGVPTDWLPCSTISRRSWTDLVWFPERREEKAVAQLCAEMLARASAGDGEWLRHHSYALVRANVLRTARRAHDDGGRPLVGVQFAVRRYRGHDPGFTPELLLLSPFISARHSSACFGCGHNTPAKRPGRLLDPHEGTRGQEAV